ncbi:AAA family ATPase [Lactobacillus acidophilus]
MRLKQIKIVNFGQFSDQTFDLPSDKIDVFFGANEAGKSTTVAFIKQILFGFHLRSNSSPFFEDYTPLAHVSPMGGSLVFENNGSEYKLERLYAKGDKTKRGILTVKKDGEVVPESIFYDQIQNIDGSFYADSFIFNQEMLGQVSSLSQEDLLERIYYLGAADSGKLLELRDDFAKEAGKLFKKTGKKPEVNRLLKQVEIQRDSLVKTQAEFTDYETLAQKVSAKKSELVEKQKSLADLQKKADNLYHLEKEVSNYQNLLDLQKQSKNISFDSENYQRAQDIMAQGRNLKNTIQALEEQINNLSDINLANVTEDKRLVQQKPQLLQWQAEYRACVQKQEQLEQEKNQLLTLSSELREVLNLSSTKIQQLQTDYTNLPKVEEKELIVNSNNKFWYAVGGTLAGLGLVLLGAIGSLGIVALVTGIIFIAAGYVKNNNDHKQNAVILEKQKLVAKKREDFQANYGLNPDTLNLNNLLTNLNQYRLKESAEKTNAAQINEINQETEQLATNLQNVLKMHVDNNFDDLLFSLDELENQVSHVQEISQQKTNLTASLAQDNQDLKELGLKLQALLAKADVKDMAEYDKLYQESLHQTKLQTQIEVLKKSLNNDLAKLQQIVDQPNELQKQLQIMTEKIAATTDEVNTLQQQVAELQVQLNNLSDSTAVFEAKQGLANAETNFTNSSKEYLANLLAAKWISRSLDIASNERFPKMLKAAKEYLKLLTGGRYVDLELDKKITVIRNDGKKREVKYLSRGTAEQLYFALKLAFIEQIKDKINLPILIDDSFVNFDDRRIGYIDKLLKKISKNNQVLIFTAQESLVNKLQIKPLTFMKGIKDA